MLQVGDCIEFFIFSLLQDSIEVKLKEQNYHLLIESYFGVKKESNTLRKSKEGNSYY